MKTVKLYERSGDFAEDKDAAAAIREKIIRPALKDGETVVLDFEGVTLTTQSFLHAMVSAVLRTNGAEALDQLVFKNCNDGIKGLVRTVVQYSLETVEPT